MAAEAPRSIVSPDSYIGSFISLTSKSEIRYEGILYNINTDESSIGLRNVRSFGTEGRKKDGHQVPSSDKIYEFILFRGSDIKDLQVKASPPAQITPMQNDPSIIQSNYSPSPTASSSLPANLPSFGRVSAPELISNTAQLGLQHPSFQGSLSTYQTGGSFGTWNATPLPPMNNVSPLAAPNWQGYYAHLQGLSHLQQPPLMRPPPGLAIPPMQHTLQLQNTNALISSGPSNFPVIPPLFPPVSSSLNLASTSLSSTVTPTQLTSLTTEMSPFSVSNKVSNTFSPAPIPSVSLPTVSSLASSMETSAFLLQEVPSVASSKSKTSPFSSVSSQTETRSTQPIVGSFGSKQQETLVTLVTPDQKIQLTPSMHPFSQSIVTVANEVKFKPPKDRTKALLSEQSVPESEARTKLAFVPKEPILLLPSSAYQKPSGAILHATQTSRGNGRGGGAGYVRPVVKFSEEFDFTAMNEKFNKDKVWGNLGKSKAHSSNREEEHDADQFHENNAESLNVNVKPVYVKDDFFDTLSCNNNEQTSSGRIKFSEQLKIDNETFGNFQRNHSASIGHGLRGGGRGWSSYPGRSHGYSARGRGYSRSNGVS